MTNTDDVKTQEEFVKFVRYLRDVYRNDPTRWENNTLESYLDALAGWVEDLEGVYQHWNREIPTDVSWSLIAKMLDAATVYE